MLGLVVLTLLGGCRVELGPPGRAAEDAGAHEVWVYTSIYQEVLDAMSARADAELPGVKIVWFQAGSEKVAQRWEAEHAAGGSRACVLATSDPGWYARLSAQGELLPYVSPRALEAPRGWVTADHAPIRVGLVVLAASSPDAPASFGELTDPRWKDRFSTGDPLASGTTFTTLAAWEARYGWSWVEALQGNGWIAAGGNSAVMARMETGERPVGVVLLENLLAKPEVARVVWPSDGAVAVPGFVGIPRDCGDVPAARQVVDWLMTDSAQAAIVAGGMHSPFPGVPPPAGAPSLADVVTFDARVDLTARVAAEGDALKRRVGELRR